MIRGRVDAEFQPMIGLQLRKQTGGFIEFDVKFDTGFNGELGLPKTVLQTLKTEPVETAIVRFANGVAQQVDAYVVEALVDGAIVRMTAVDLGSGSRLLGMKALPSWNGFVEFKVNGDVTIRQPQETIQR